MVVVEGSDAQRAHLVRTLQAEGTIVVVGQATGATEAIAIAQAVRPDVLTLDLQIGDGGGQVVIEQLMSTAPIPILVLSSGVSNRESEAAVAALMAGAVDVLPKPDRWDEDTEKALRSRVRLVGGVAVVRRMRPAPRNASRHPVPTGAELPTAVPIVAIGASTGGPAALAAVLAGLGRIGASVLVVQHLHADFVDGLVSWMGRVATLDVELARHDQLLQPGVVSIAPSGTHLRVSRGNRIVLDPLPETLHRPAVDELFASLAERTEGRIVAVLLTGMGEDGAAGMLSLQRRGHVTIAQDEATSVVFGMPRAAQRLGAATHILPLEQIASTIVRSI